MWCVELRASRSENIESLCCALSVRMHIRIHLLLTVHALAPSSGSVMNYILTRVDSILVFTK